MKISNSCIDQIKEAIQIADVIGDFIHLTKKGTNYVACCPFHNEKTGSFMVNPARNSFKCFGCGKSGDAIEFLREHEGMNFGEALEFIAKKYKIKIEREGADDDYSEQEKLREGIFNVLSWAQKHFSKNLSNSKQAKEYIESRQIGESVKEFGIGYAAYGNDLLRAAAASGYSPDILFAAGLVKKNTGDGHYFDAFSKRIIFPFYDRTGRIIGFTGRILVPEKDKPKYLHTAETEVFKKSKFLYGLFNSRKYIIQEQECLILEGQTDFISLFLAGIRNVVAGSGTSMSEDQAKMIRSFTQRITIIYDGDPAGIKAAVKNITVPLQLGLDVYVLVLPDGEDPDSMVRRIGGEAMKSFIEKNRKDIVSFRIDMVIEEIQADPMQKARLIKELTTQISIIPDEEIRGILIAEIAKKLDVSVDDLKLQVKKKLLAPTEKQEKGFFGFNQAIDCIREKNQVIILGDHTEVVGRHASGDENVISLPDGILSKNDIIKLHGICKNVVIEGLGYVTGEDDQELPLAKAGRELTENGMHVQVAIQKEVEDIVKYDDFLDFYVEKLAYYLYGHPDTKRSKKYVEMVAEFLSKLDNTIIHIKTNEISKKFGLTQAAFTKVLKPYVDKRKSLAAQSQEKIVIDETQYVFDIAHLPEYVDLDFYQRYGFFAAENKTGHKIFYVFRTLENTLAKVGNFYMEPLFHVHDPDPQRNKRIAKLYHAELNKEEYVELRSSDMTELSQFKKFLWNVGGYVFIGGKQFHYDKILESHALKYPKCTEIFVFGSHLKGFFSWSNGIIADGVFTSVDELGLVRYKGETYYIPAFSKIYKDQSADNDRYEYDRYLYFKADHKTTWKEWSTLMHKVYRYNNNGMWALLFTILAAHRSVIFQIDRIFTSIFFIGPTESGKSKIAESIRAPWMYGAPLFNLNSGTDAAFFTALERFRDVPVIFEEYNDYQISDTKFQGLKAAVYDNEGKQKRKDAASKDIDVSKINASLLLLGQEGPERDDGSLGNRVVQKHVPKKDDWTDEEMDLYNDLKRREADGLNNIALEIYNRRKVIQSHFAGYFRKFQKQVREDIKAEGGSYQTRIINTVSLFITIAKLWDEHVKDLPLPFSFDEFYIDAKKQIISQSHDISSSNRLSVFFDTIGMMYAQGQIVKGREFDIEINSQATVQVDRTTTDATNWKGEKKKILFLIVNDVIQMYQRLHGSESLKLNTLRMYLKDHPAFIGQVKSHRFSYQEEKWEQDPVTDKVMRVLKKAERNTSCIALDYEILFKDGLDLEKVKEAIQMELPINNMVNGNGATLEQEKLIFTDRSILNCDDDGLPF